MRLKNMKSLAFCCISTGIDGYPIDKAVLVALRTVRLWLEELKSEHKMLMISCTESGCSLSSSPHMNRNQLPSQPVHRSHLQKNAATGYSGPTGEHIGDNIASVEDAVGLEQKKQRELRALPVFIELTTEPDMMGLDDDDPNAKRAKMPCGHVIGFESMTAYSRDILNNANTSSSVQVRNAITNGNTSSCVMSRASQTKKCTSLSRRWRKTFSRRSRGTRDAQVARLGVREFLALVTAFAAQFALRIEARSSTSSGFVSTNFHSLRRFLSTGSCGNLGCDGRDKRIHILATCLTKKIDYCLNCPIIRGCQKCGILIEHKDKCGHVYCRNCHTGFCFICLKEKKDGEWQCKPYLNTCKLAPRQSTLPGSR